MVLILNHKKSVRYLKVTFLFSSANCSSVLNNLVTLGREKFKDLAQSVKEVNVLTTDSFLSHRLISVLE